MNMSENILNEVRNLKPLHASQSSEFVGHLLRIFAVLGAIAILVVSSAVALLFGVGHWLFEEDSLQKANAIAVLSRHFPAHALESASLYRAATPSEIWFAPPGTQTD